MLLRRALVVDDDPASLTITRLSLERIGQLVVATATSGAAAVAAAANAPPDVILLDVSLPDLDGRTVLARLRGDHRTGSIPVIFLTAHAMLDEVRALMAAGAAGVIIKPIDARTLPDEVRRVVGRHRRAPTPRLAVGSTGIPVIAHQPSTVATRRLKRRSTTAPVGLRILVIDDESLCSAMIDRILRRDHDVTITHSGAQALAWIRDGERYDVVLCDLVMPTLTGEDVHRILVDEQPAQAARFGLVTGGPSNEAGARFLARMASRVLWKPFGADELTAFVTRIAAGSTAPAIDGAVPARP